jgi:formylglycine-generating enzyme required for sulfatase activity
MVSDTKTSDALPLLAFTLRELCEGYGQDKLLTLEEYRDKLGRLDGSLARAAEAVLNAEHLSEKEGSVLRMAFLSMVQVNDKEQYAKQPVKWTDLPISIHHILERFVTARLLISGGDKNGRTIEVAHEALFRAWPRLAKWLEDNHAFLVWRQRLNAKKKEWETKKWNPILVLPLADDAEEWLKKNPDSFLPEERIFITKIRRQMWQLSFLGIMAITLATTSLYIYVGLSGTGLLSITDPAEWLWKAEAPIKYFSSAVLSRLHVVSVAEPKMVEIPGGTYPQGSSSEKSEQPVHQVTVKPFLMSQYEVTFAEYDQYVRISGSDPPFDSDWGRKDRPVINVSWEDASDYAEWLSLATGKQYRLPTESQWEYAARSGGRDLTWAGTSDEKKLADYSVYNTTRTEEVGSKKSNGLNLYDMSGNVWEWVKDCWHEDYNGAPTDGSAWLGTLETFFEDKCRQRVARGGSWHSAPKELRASNRDGANTGLRSAHLGFRLVQD